MRRLAHVALAIALACLAGCASVPRESVELSTTIGRDLDAVHASHRALAELHFDDLLRRVDAFVDEEYRPFILRESMAELDVVGALESALAGEGDLDVLDIMSIVVEEALAQIAAFRAEMRAPIERQRHEVLTTIDQAYRQLQTANAVVTGHLASVRKVHEAQAGVLDDAGLADMREGLARRLAAVSDAVGEVLEDARHAEAALAEAPARLDRAVTASR